LVELAWDASSDPGSFRKPGFGWRPQRLFYYCVTEARARAVAHFRKIETIPDDEVDVELDVSRFVPDKHTACLAHETQRAFYEQLQTAAGGLDRYWSTEHHVLGRHVGARPAGRLGDLFAGLPEDRQ
jgi:hypothetical protein